MTDKPTTTSTEKPGFALGGEPTDETAHLPNTEPADETSSLPGTEPADEAASLPGTESDDALYRRFRDGDNTGYEQLTIRYGDSLTRYLYGYVHDIQEAEDLMIDAFVQILVKKPSIGEGAFKAYLYRTARNLALRFRERRTRLQTFSIEGIEGEIPDRETVESSLGEQERQRALYACLNRIEPELREALWLVYIERMSYAQVAEVMRVKPKRVDRLLARGKQSLRRELEKEGVVSAYDK